MMSLPGHNHFERHTVRRLFAGLVLVVGCLSSTLAGAQGRILFQGILDAELYDTDTGSILLARNEGDIATLGRLQLWTAFQLTPSLQLYALGESEIDNFTGDTETESELDQAALRYNRQSAPWFSVEAGKLLSPLATYSERRLSTRNPLIGQPYAYAANYPLGVKVAGSAGWLDYQAALIDTPASDPDFQAIDPDSAYRPVLGFGVTPLTGLRIGFTWTQGPYLNREISPYLPAGRQWRDYDQRVMGLDLQFSRGYLEVSGQVLQTRYEVPILGRTDDYTTYFLELKYTFTPRLFGAVRYQDVEASYVDYPEHNYWYTEIRKFRALEVGVGYRFSPELLGKVAYQTDHWDETEYRYDSNARGHALGLQLSWAFDLVSLLSGDP
jgi:hypothetical protein